MRLAVPVLAVALAGCATTASVAQVEDIFARSHFGTIPDSSFLQVTVEGSVRGGPNARGLSLSTSVGEKCTGNDIGWGNIGLGDVETRKPFHGEFVIDNLSATVLQLRFELRSVTSAGGPYDAGCGAIFRRS